MALTSREGTDQQGGHLGLWLKHPDFSMENNCKTPSKQRGPKAFSSPRVAPFPAAVGDLALQGLGTPRVLTEKDRPARLLILMISVMVTLRQPRSVAEAEGWSGAGAQPRLSFLGVPAPRLGALAMGRKGRSSHSMGKGIVWDHARGGKLGGCAKGRVKEEGWSRGKMLKSCVSLRHGIPEKNPNQTVGTPIFLSLLPPPHTAGTKDRGQLPH